MSQVNAQRLERQLDILRELRELNLIEPKATFEYTCYRDDDYITEDSRIAEDTIRFQLRSNCGEWSGNYQDFQALCRMVRNLGQPSGHTPWERLGITEYEWDALLHFEADKAAATPVEAIYKIVRRAMGH